MDQFRTVIVDAANVAQARSLASEGLFTTPCSPSGNDPATHYISSGYMPLAELSGITADISTEPPFTALTRKGLKIIIPLGV